LTYRRLELEQLENRIVPSVTLISHYNGIDFNGSLGGASGGFVPPDTNGAAGPNSYVETTNQAVSIFSPKNTGSTVVTDGLDDFYFTQGGLAHASPTSNLSDPVVLWDEQVQRFIVADQDVDFTNHVNTFDIAVSTSDSPTTLTTADWNFFQVNTTEAGFDEDYPGNLGFNHDAFVYTLNSFSTTGGSNQVQIDSIDINALVSGTPLVLGTNAFINDFAGFSLRPATMHDSVAGDPMWFVTEAGTNTDINVVQMTNVLSNAPVFTTTTIGVTPYSTAVPELQPDGTTITTNTDSRIMKAAMQNGLLVAAHQVSDAAGDLDQVQWYVFNTSGGTPTLQQQGNVGGGPGTYFVYPGIDINPAGDIGMSYIASGTHPGQFMSTYITGRTPADAPGTMEASVLVQQGQANYADFAGGREGDLSGINVDANGSFWISNEFANTEPNANWGTTIANFTLAAPLAIVLANATEGVPLINVPVATFIDNSGAPLSSYNATISWGDGSTTAGQVVANGSGSFTVLGSHTYLEEGGYTLTVSVSNGSTTLGPVSGIVNVADAPLIAGPAQTLNTKVGAFLTDFLLATFTDTDSSPEDPSNYAAIVSFFEPGGIFVNATGRIAALGNNTFAVFGSSPFSYAAAGTFAVRVVIRDVGGASVVVNDTVNVLNNPAIPPLIPMYQADGGPLGPLFLMLQNSLTNLISAEKLFIASLTGPVPHQEFVIPNLINAFMQYEMAVFQFDIRLPSGPAF